MIRKIISIAFEVTGYIREVGENSRDGVYGGDGSTSSCLHALCNDGTIWFLAEGEWAHLETPPIPQDKIEQETSDEP